MNQQQQLNPVDIPINKGTRPDWETRLGYPKLVNFFCGESGFIYPSPGLAALANIKNPRAVHFSSFGDGFYIVVNKNQVLQVSLNGVVTIIATIGFSGLAVQIDENIQNQITIVDGQKAYVYSPATSIFTQLGESQGFAFESPCSVVVLNTFTIILDRNTRQWAVSSPNNALSWPALNSVQFIESQLNIPVSLETLNNNLYIFGTTGIERWIPTLGTNAYAFPFTQDTNFRKDFGAISTNGVIRGRDIIYFLSSEYIPMALEEGNTKIIGDVGMSKIISQYKDVANCVCSFYTFRGNLFCAYTFQQTGISWVFCQNSSTWSQYDDLVLGAIKTREVVITPIGLFTLSLIPSIKTRDLISERIILYKGQQTFRNTLNGIEARIVQGLNQLPSLGEYHYLRSTLSIDSKSWLNTVARPIGLTGKRNAVTIWRTSLAAYEFTIWISYTGDLDFTIEKLTAYIN